MRPAHKVDDRDGAGPPDVPGFYVWLARPEASAMALQAADFVKGIVMTAHAATVADARVPTIGLLIRLGGPSRDALKTAMVLLSR